MFSRRFITLRLLPLVFICFAVPPNLLGENRLRVGVAEVDITPPLGYPMAGYYHERLATGVKDPLKARAMVWIDGDCQAALVICDLTGIAVDFSLHVRRRAAEATGIPAEHIVVAATHSHTAPDYTRDLYQHLAGDDSAGDRPRHAARMIEAAVEAIVQANQAARPAVIEAGSAIQRTPVSFNRRFVMRDGSVRTWMRLDHPEVIRAAGPIDPQVGMAVVRTVDGERPLAVLSNFALHLDTVGGTLWSADYPHFVEQGLRDELGPNVISLFGLGCCGDINHADPASKERNSTAWIGGELAATMRGAVAGLPRLARTDLRVRHEVVRLPLESVEPDEAAHARKQLEAIRSGAKLDFFDQVTAYKRVLIDRLLRGDPANGLSEPIGLGLSHTWSGIGDHVPVDVTVIAVGDELAIVYLPGEPFVELGLAIKQASPFRTTLIVELANSVEMIYLPTRVAYAGGSYEVTNSMVQPGSGERLAETAVRLLRDAAGR
ncbi:MAG: neutral/alkaline non-lysosomal ceramidase N-terminal domain-containing protein [Pirellulaceae bacterium]|nr:neutral/alkaline non-lysosomal ceramidase N-terminal domain-containing protein [Pirellulaceae bacterium]